MISNQKVSALSLISFATQRSKEDSWWVNKVISALTSFVSREWSSKKKQNCAKVSENATRVNLRCLKTTAKHDSLRHFCTQIETYNNTISRTKNKLRMSKSDRKVIKMVIIWPKNDQTLTRNDLEWPKIDPNVTKRWPKRDQKETRNQPKNDQNWTKKDQKWS